MTDVAGLIQKAAEKLGYVRERFDIKRIPTDPSNICVIPFFGDIRSLFILSSLLLRRYREEEKPSKYFILATWPGFQSLFPYVDEVWGVEGEVDKLYLGARQFRNKSPLVSSYYRNLNQYFFEDIVIPHEYFGEYYGHGIQNGFWNKYRQIKRFMPLVPSAAQMTKDFNKQLANRGGFKVFVYPSMFTSIWRFEDIEQVQIDKKFWVSLIQRLIYEKFVPVVYKGLFTHDVSIDFTDQCVYINDIDISKVMGAMRSTGCVLDLFNGISRIALAARCPFLMVDEHSRYSALKEYEIDDLCGSGLPKQYLYSFPTIIEQGNPNNWDFNLFNGIVSRLHSFLPTLNRDEWPSTGESYESVSYDSVRKKKAKKMGTRLLKISKG